MTFFTMLVGSGVRAVPTVLIDDFQGEFGWGVDLVSLAVGVNLVLFGLTAPFGAGLMERFGVRAVVSTAFAAMASAVALSLAMRSVWQLIVLWGVVVGAASGCVSSPLAAIVATRWFHSRRGLATGLLSAAYATGQLVFLPALAALSTGPGWRWASGLVIAATILVVPAVVTVLRDRPRDLGLAPYGAVDLDPVPTPRGNPFVDTIRTLRQAARHRAFWLLAGTFFVCGFTTVGIVATHLIPAAHDHAISETTAAGLLALIGVFDIIGTTLSGWLTDRYDPRRLLFAFYALRGASLFLLPYLLEHRSAAIVAFAIVYGLDWVATVPPTVRLATEIFGPERVGIVYGWIFAAHQLGAATAAWTAGLVREGSGSYVLAFIGAGVVGVAAGVVALGVDRLPRALAGAPTR